MENLERQGSGFTTIALPPEKTEHSECAAPEAEVAYPNGEAKSRDGSGPDLPTDTIDDKQASLSNEREKKESPRKEGRFMSLMEGIFQKKKQAQSQADSEPSKKEDSTSPRERKQEEAEATTTENGRIISVATRENRYVEAEEAQTATSPANLFRIYQDACKAAQVQPNSKAIAQVQRITSGWFFVLLSSFSTASAGNPRKHCTFCPRAWRSYLQNHLAVLFLLLIDHSSCFRLAAVG